MNEQGQYFVSYNQPHLSIWIISFDLTACLLGANIDIVSDIDFTDPEHYYFAELVNANSGDVIATNLFRFYNGEIITLFRVPDETAIFKVYDGFTEECPGNLVQESAPFSLCDGDFTMDLSSVFTGDDLFTVNVNVQGTCSSEFDDLVIIPTVPLLYRECGCDTWSDLGTLISGAGSTSALVKRSVL